MINIPQFYLLQIPYKNHVFSIEYFIRQGKKGTLLFVHGLGGAKENFLESCKSEALNGYTLIGFDHPGTGNSSYYTDCPLDIDDLVSISELLIKQLQLKDFILCGASMGGLIALLYMKKNPGKVKAFINIEGNLMPEDCMFSSQVVIYEHHHFCKDIFPRVIRDMKANGNTGYRIIANNLEMNTHASAYYHYSFQTAEYSSTGNLLQLYLDLDIPTLFVYGDKNRTLSYLQQLDRKQTSMIPDSDHFIFYDHPKKLYEEMGRFIGRLFASS